MSNGCSSLTLRCWARGCGADIDNALLPIVKGLAGHPGLGGYEILNEMEGSVIAGQSNANACFDTDALSGTGAGWSGGQIPMVRPTRASPTPL